MQDEFAQFVFGTRIAQVEWRTFDFDRFAFDTLGKVTA